MISVSVLKYWLWLSAAENVSVASKAKVLEYYRDAEAAYFAPDGELQGVLGISAGEAAVLERRDLRAAEELLERCRRENISVLTMQDAAYPKRLRQIYAPPAVLYVRGKLPALDDEAAVAVIGTRQATPYGLRMGGSVAYEIAKCGGVVVSGLTSGIDSAAARGALRGEGVCIGILGCAIDGDNGPLAQETLRRGALISEHGPGVPTMKSFFRDRNRISAGISVGVVVIEAPEKSGTRLFVNEAAEQGKEIFALPGNADSASCAGTNAILKEGAHLVTTGREVMEELRPLFPQKIRMPEKIDLLQEPIIEEETKIIASAAKKDIDKENGRGYIDLKEQLSQLSEEQLKIIMAIDGKAEHIDDIIETTGLGTAKVLAQLTVLEIKGYVRREAGRRITLNTAKK